MRVRGIYLLKLLNLRGVEALHLLAPPTEQRLRVKEAPAWDLDYAVLDAVDTITLPKDLVVDEPCPSLGRDEVVGSNGARYGVEHGSLPLEVVEVNGRGPRDDAVIVVGEGLGGLDAHPSAERAAEIVRVRWLAAVEPLNELLGGHGPSVEAFRWVQCQYTDWNLRSTVAYAL